MLGGKDEHLEFPCRAAHRGHDHGPGRVHHRAQQRDLCRAPSRPEEDITVAAIPSLDLAGLYVAQDKGLFAKQGLHVTIKKIPSSKAVIAAQLKGQVDISAGSYVAYIAAQAAGARFRILAEASTLRPDTRTLVVTANSRSRPSRAWPARRSG